MKHWLLFALSSTICVAETRAAPGDEHGTDEWSNLDRDIEALATTQAEGTGNLAVHGLVRAAYLSAPNLLTPSQDLSGTRIINAQAELDGQVTPDIGVRLQLEAAGGSAQLLDAYGTWRLNDLLHFTMGNFRAPLLWESQLADGDLLFLLRTDAAELFYGRDQGAMVDGAWERLHWAVSMQNGVDAVAGRQAFCGRVGVDVLGKNAGLHQGAYGQDESMSLTVAGSFYNDSGVSKDGSVYSSDAQFHLGRFAADASFTKYADGTSGGFTTRTDAQSWAATASFLLMKDLEAAARYQDIDNDKNARDITFGLNYYMQGHAAKLQLNLSQVYSDDPTVDDTYRAGIGMAVSV
jgi:hypothetical protein